MKRRPRDLRQNERGAALVSAIFSVLLVTVIAFAFVSSGIISGDISKNSRNQSEAYYISEAGLAHATNLVVTAGTAQFTSMLAAGDGAANTGDELSTRPTALTPIPSAGLAFGTGRYRVFLIDDPADADGNPNADSNDRIVIRSVGTGQNGASVTTEAVVSVGAGSAMLVNGNLRLNGNPIISGTGGSVHSNGILDFDGNPCASLYFSSSQNIVDPGNSLGAGCIGPGVNRPNQPVITVPIYDIRATFMAASDFVLGAQGSRAGRVYNGAGTLIHDATSTGNKWTVGSSEWSWDTGGARWVHGGNVLPTGTYYSEGNMGIPDNFGSPAIPVTATLIAEGYIDVSGNPFFRPDYQNYSMMAGTDLVISGNPGAGSTNFMGLQWAGHQIKFSGDPAINGMVIAANQADTYSPTCGCNPVPLSSGYMEISGNPTITYNGGIIDSGATVVSWRECGTKKLIRIRLVCSLRRRSGATINTL